MTIFPTLLKLDQIYLLQSKILRIYPSGDLSKSLRKATLLLSELRSLVAAIAGAVCQDEDGVFHSGNKVVIRLITPLRMSYEESYVKAFPFEPQKTSTKLSLLFKMSKLVFFQTF